MFDNHNVFINCPFDEKYQVLEDAIIFTVLDCGFIPRSAKESSASRNRMLKILEIIGECHFSVHDISRTELDVKNKLPRFNMPFELGLFLGAKHFGGDKHNHKDCIIFDKKPHRYEKFISDIKGYDVIGHGDSPRKVIDPIRDCLAEFTNHQKILSGKEIYERYLIFLDWLNQQKIKRTSLSFGKFSHFISEFLTSLGKNKGDSYAEKKTKNS